MVWFIGDALDIIDIIAEPEQLQNFPMVAKWCESILRDILMKLNHVISVDIEKDIENIIDFIQINPILKSMLFKSDDKIIVVPVYKKNS